MARFLALFALTAALDACGAPEPAASTGGAAGHGLAVVSSDWQSTTVSLVGTDGRVLSPLLVSSGSAAAGLSSALSGDVALPSQPSAPGELVLIDRANDVLTWLDSETGRVRGQLGVGTGFHSNPHDYVALDDGRALVPRYEHNPTPGRSPFDAGDDLLVVDPAVPTILGSIDLSPGVESAGVLPRPERAMKILSGVVVLLGAYAADFHSSYAESRLVLLGADLEITQVLVLEGLYGCSALALSPSGNELAVACSGRWLDETTSTLEESGLAVVSVANTLRLEQRWFASELGGAPFGLGLDWVSPERLLVTTLGQELEPARDDSALEVDLTRATARVLLTSSAFALWDVRCLTDACFLADAAAAAPRLRRFPIGAAGLEAPEAILVDRTYGLGPRFLGRF